MKIIIIEDEPKAAKGLCQMLELLDSSIEVLSIIESVAEGVEYFAIERSVDLIFSDIQLEDGLSFEIFEKVTIKSPIIFTTAYNQYAIQAFETNGIGYLLKPFDQEQLTKSIKKYQELSPQIALEKLVAVASTINNQQAYKSRFLVKAGDKIKTIPVKEVIAFYSVEKATYLSTIEGKKHIIDHSLDQLERILDPLEFFRINRKTILWLGICTDLQSWSSSRIKVNNVLLGHLDTVVSRDRYKYFKDWLDR